MTLIVFTSGKISVKAVFVFNKINGNLMFFKNKKGCFCPVNSTFYSIHEFHDSDILKTVFFLKVISNKTSKYLIWLKRRVVYVGLVVSIDTSSFSFLVYFSCSFSCWCTCLGGIMECYALDFRGRVGFF